MRFRGGGVGHKTTREETRCLLDDRDELDKVPFVMESEIDRDQMELDDEDEDEEDSEEDEEEDRDEDEEGENDNEMDEDEGSEEGQESGAKISSATLANEELVDEMDEFGYSGLDQVVDQDDEGEELLEEDGLGAEDGENARDDDGDEFFADL